MCRVDVDERRNGARIGRRPRCVGTMAAWTRDAHQGADEREPPGEADGVQPGRGRCDRGRRQAVSVASRSGSTRSLGPIRISRQVRVVLVRQREDAVRPHHGSTMSRMGVRPFPAHTQGTEQVRGFRDAPLMGVSPTPQAPPKLRVGPAASDRGRSTCVAPSPSGPRHQACALARVRQRRRNDQSS